MALVWVRTVSALRPRRLATCAVEWPSAIELKDLALAAGQGGAAALALGGRVDEALGLGGGVDRRLSDSAGELLAT